MSEINKLQKVNYGVKLSGCDVTFVKIINFNHLITNFNKHLNRESRCTPVLVSVKAM